MLGGPREDPAGHAIDVFSIAASDKFPLNYPHMARFETVTDKRAPLVKVETLKR